MCLGVVRLRRWLGFAQSSPPARYTPFLGESVLVHISCCLVLAIDIRQIPDARGVDLLL